MCKVTDSFATTTTFSGLDLSLAAHNDGISKVALDFNTLFGISLAEIEVDDVVKFLYRCKNWQWPLPPFVPEATKKRSESNIMLDIATEILRRLCVNVSLERKYGAFHPPFITCEDIGIGTVKTWHGSPDGCVRGGACFVLGEEEDTDEYEDGESDDDSVHSDGRTTMEAKKLIKESHLPQVVGTCVTASFTERNLHPEKLAMIPTVLIGEKSFRVVLYDCEKDILIISSRKSLSTNGHLSQSAMVLLWAVFNHR